MYWCQIDWSRPSRCRIAAITGAGVLIPSPARTGSPGRACTIAKQAVTSTAIETANRVRRRAGEEGDERLRVANAEADQCHPPLALAEDNSRVLIERLLVQSDVNAKGFPLRSDVLCSCGVGRLIVRVDERQRQLIAVLAAN